jgi:hypothetical protein
MAPTEIFRFILLVGFVVGNYFAFYVWKNKGRGNKLFLAFTIFLALIFNYLILGMFMTSDCFPGPGQGCI